MADGTLLMNGLISEQFMGMPTEQEWASMVNGLERLESLIRKEMKGGSWVSAESGERLVVGSSSDAEETAKPKEKSKGKARRK